MGKRGRPARIIRCAKPAKCPKCGNRHFLIVVYGYPSNEVIDEIDKLQINLNFQISITIVNDASNHDRFDEKKTYANIQSIKILNMKKNQGHTRCIATGLKYIFEKENFDKGTIHIAKMIADSKGFSVAGGGDTILAAEKAGVLDRLDYVSTAGGAFLEFMEGRKLPAIEALGDKVN